MSPNRWAMLYRTDIGASGGRFSKNSLCLKAAVWIQPRPHCRRRGRQRARRRAPLEGVKGAEEKKHKQPLSQKRIFFLFWQFLMLLKPKFPQKLTFQNGLHVKSVQEVHPCEGPHEIDFMDFLSKFIGFQQIYHEVSFQMLISRENLVI